MSKCLSLEDLEALIEQHGEPEAEVRAHLDACEHCRARLEEVRENLALFQACAKLAPSELGEAVGGRDHNRFSGAPLLKEDDERLLDYDEPAPIQPDAVPGYEILGEIRRGAQGIVYRATQLATKRTVALKVMLHGPFASRRQRRRFEREIELVAGLDHPNIVQVFESGRAEERFYFAMQYVEGLPLRDYLSGRRPDMRDVLALFVKICRAVAHAHARGIIHRDLKPSNVLVDAGGEPHVLDFGLAKPIDAAGGETLATQTGEFFGTLAYASPEQVSGLPGSVDARTDVYAIGMILYESLTGQTPYPTVGSVTEVVRHINDTDPPRLSSEGTTADPEVDAIVRKALEKDPDRRYATANALADDIERYLEGRPIEARPYSGMYVLKKAIARHKAIAAVTLASVLGLVGLTILAGVNARLAQRERDRAVAAEHETAAQRDRAVAAEREAQRALYYSRIQMANTALQRDDIAEAKQALDACPPELRGWEWYRLRWASDQSILTYTGHEADLGGIKLSEDGRLAATNDRAYFIKVWEVATGKTLWSGRHAEDVLPWAYAFWNDGRRLAAPATEKVVRVWSIPDGKCLLELPHPRPWAVYACAGSLVTVADDRPRAIGEGPHAVSIRIWDERTGRLVRHIPQQGQSLRYLFTWDETILITGTDKKTYTAWRLPEGEEVLTFSHWHAFGAQFYAEKNQLLVGGRRAIKLFDCATGECLFDIPAEHVHPCRLGLSKDGKRLLASAYDDLRDPVICWDTDSGALLWEKAPKTDRPDVPGPWWAHVANGRIYLLDPKDESQRRVFCGHSGKGLGLKVSSDRSRIVSVGGEASDATCKVWDPSLPGAVMTWKTRGGPYFARFSPDGAQFAVAIDTDRGIAIYDAQDVKAPVQVLQALSPDPYLLHYSPDGRYIADVGYTSGPLRIWDLHHAAEVATLGAHRERISSLVWHPNGQWIVSGSHDGTVCIWDAESGKTVRVLQHDGEVGELAVSPDGRWIASGGARTPLYLWDAQTGQQQWTRPGHTNEIDALAFSPDGRFLVSGDNAGTLMCWTIPEGEQRWSNATRELRMYCAIFTREGQRVLTGGKEKISIFDAATGQLIMSWKAHGNSSSIFSLDLSPDGRNLLSVGVSDKTVKIWPTAPTPRKRTTMDSSTPQPLGFTH